MAAGLDALKSYLVKLGFDVDNEGFNKFKNTLSEISAAVVKNSTEIKQQYAEGAVAVVSAVTTMTGAITALASKVAESDIYPIGEPHTVPSVADSSFSGT